MRTQKKTEGRERGPDLPCLQVVEPRPDPEMTLIHYLRKNRKSTPSKKKPKLKKKKKKENNFANEGNDKNEKQNGKRMSCLV